MNPLQKQIIPLLEVAAANPSLDGLDSEGGTIANVILGTVESGKTRGQFLRAPIGGW